MNPLKTIVIALGATLVVAFGMLIFGLTQNWHKVAGTPAKPASGGWGQVDLNLPAGAQVKSVTASGNHIVLQVESGGQKLIVLDPASGAIVGTFTVVP